MRAAKRIVFVLPLHCRCAGGGLRVVFEYANRFAAKGWNVSIAMAAATYWRRRSFTDRLRLLAYYLFCKTVRSNRYPNWFELDSRIKCITVFEPTRKSLPTADVYVATGIETADYMSWFQDDSSVKAYLIQHYEDWVATEDVLVASYKSRFVKFVISKWLNEIVSRYSPDPTILLPNGFDFSKLFIENPPESRNPFRVALMYSEARFKDFRTGYDAVVAAHEKDPRILALIFGTPCRPSWFPSWVRYVQNPSSAELRAVYNEAAIFVGSSISEGWGLPVGEAMACGAAVCCTRCNGYLEMVNENQNALVSAVGDADGLARNILSLAHDDEWRLSMASHGAADIRKFSWESSFSILERTLLDRLG